MLLKLLSLTAVLVIYGSTSFAQTATDTVVYMLHGVAPGEFPKKPENSNMSEFWFTSIPDGTPGVLAGYLASGNLTPIFQAAYNQNSCLTDLTLSARVDSPALKPVAKLTLDWSKVSGITLQSGQDALKTNVSGLTIKQCDALVDKGCDGLTPESIKGFFVSVAKPERLTKALSYFQTNFCKGSAF